MSRGKKRWIVAASVFVLVTVVLTTAFYWIENSITEETAASVHAWVGLLGGTLPDLDKDNIDRMTYGFASTITVKFYLLLLPILGIIGLFYQIVTIERRQFMRWMDLLETRDGAIKTAILRNLINQEGVDDPESLKRTSDILDQLFQEAGQVWEEEYLPRMFNQETVESLRRELHKVQ